MISPEMKAQAQLAYQNWVQRNQHTAPPVTEEGFLEMIEELQATRNRNRISQSEFENTLTTLLRDPGQALEVSTYHPPKRSTDSLMHELTRLHKSGILTDQEFEERRDELFFERNVNPDPAVTAAVDAETDRKDRFREMLDELQKAGVLLPQEADAGRQRLDSIVS